MIHLIILELLNLYFFLFYLQRRSVPCKSPREELGLEWSLPSQQILKNPINMGVDTLFYDSSLFDLQTPTGRPTMNGSRAASSPTPAAYHRPTVPVSSGLRHHQVPRGQSLMNLGPSMIYAPYGYGQVMDHYPISSRQVFDDSLYGAALTQQSYYNGSPSSIIPASHSAWNKVQGCGGCCPMTYCPSCHSLPLSHTTPSFHRLPQSHTSTYSSSHESHPSTYSSPHGSEEPASPYLVVDLPGMIGGGTSSPTQISEAHHSLTQHSTPM